MFPHNYKGNAPLQEVTKLSRFMAMQCVHRATWHLLDSIIGMHVMQEDSYVAKALCTPYWLMMLDNVRSRQK